MYGGLLDTTSQKFTCFIAYLPKNDTTQCILLIIEKSLVVLCRSLLHLTFTFATPLTRDDFRNFRNVFNDVITTPSIKTCKSHVRTSLRQVLHLTFNLPTNTLPSGNMSTKFKSPCACIVSNLNSLPLARKLSKT